MKKEKLVHLISNEVTLNDVVNAILAVGGTAICATSPKEAEEVVSLAHALVLNIGMPSEEKKISMKLAGRRANERDLPIVLDPVGAGTTRFRGEILRELTGSIRFRCIKGNYAEIAYLCGKSFVSRGVESSSVLLSEEEVCALSKKMGAVIVATGKENLIANESEMRKIAGGSELLTKITGSGCMLSGILAVRLTETKREDAFQMVCETLTFFNESAKRAEKKMRERGEGYGSFKVYLLDALSER